MIKVQVELKVEGLSEFTLRITLSNKSCSVIPAPSLMLLAKATKIPIGSEFTVRKNSPTPMSGRERNVKRTMHLT